MNETNELLEHIYKDASMGCYTMEKLLASLKEKDNKIKGLAEDILKRYQEFSEQVKDRLQGKDIDLAEEGMFSKMMAGMGISKEVKVDNSDSAIADMLIKGVSMGSIEMEKKVKDFEKEADKKDLTIAKDFLKFQEDTIKKLKEYL